MEIEREVSNNNLLLADFNQILELCIFMGSKEITKLNIWLYQHIHSTKIKIMIFTGTAPFCTEKLFACRPRRTTWEGVRQATVIVSAAIERAQGPPTSMSVMEMARCHGLGNGGRPPDEREAMGKRRRWKNIRESVTPQAPQKPNMSLTSLPSCQSLKLGHINPWTK
jgi:hypothetical protein